ncbi:N-6 DNA methylase [Curtobacterium flaccumfaciens]|uniref:N-6 DNA methylase n=1 Tax=Curtobacterium flaccumfaciens TaxID=2035 RepID=UPI001BDE85B6|nr:N-6 DNA methylase [Curtobacterium flaccumfaciens]MBT1598489.1 N-6 DNA methylase [Curtobacterium flaccumfaciens pv. flaccumfaciens]
MTERSRAAVSRLRAFAQRRIVPSSGKVLTWMEYLKLKPRADEETLIQPVLFPAFATDLLNWDLQKNLAAETSAKEGRPDFTPADAATHPFVFETKSTIAGLAIAGYDDQVLRYLTVGAPRIRSVVLTNLISIKVFTLSATGGLNLDLSVNVKALLEGALAGIGDSAEAERFADFIQRFERKELSPDEKIVRLIDAPPWNEVASTTSSEWIVARLDSAMMTLKRGVDAELRAGALQDTSKVLSEERALSLKELRGLASRLGVENSGNLSFDDFVSASSSSVLSKALEQYSAHVSFYTAARLMLVRVWEDLRLLPVRLYSSGFAAELERSQGDVAAVVRTAFGHAAERYRTLFDQRNAYTWFRPSRDSYIDVLYDLGNTYFGDIETDVLGRVYETMLERIDRKLLGVYYTPRDIITLMWDLIDFDALHVEARQQSRYPQVLDIATGSGGFLVEAAARSRRIFEDLLSQGGQTPADQWIDGIADGLMGVEYQQFAAYLAELNLIVQLSSIAAKSSDFRIPELGVVTGDTLSLHNPTELVRTEGKPTDSALLMEDLDRATRIRYAGEPGLQMDVSVGNPPYIGEKLAAPILRATRKAYPYWENFVGPHMDYLYWFLILGVSKLRDDGQFAFITTEYWLRADGARPLRKYLSERVQIDRIILFRDFRLFPDAPGQHSMIIVGRRRASPAAIRPRVSIYLGEGAVGLNRRSVLDAIRDGRNASGVLNFTAPESLSALGGESWASLLYSREDVRRRAKLKQAPQLGVVVTKGIETTVNQLSDANREYMTANALAQIGDDPRPGVQLLSQDEVLALGQLNTDEDAALRRWVNTRDIYPYAVVLPTRGPRVVYLPKPAVPSPLGTDPVSGVQFPAGLPKLQSRMELFRPFLEANTRSKNERRPWWSLHRARANVILGSRSPGAKWEKFALTTRWGEGGRLIVGLAPAGSAPASGLHMLRGADAEMDPAYLVGLYNSSMYQEVAESLPPGQLRQADLEALGVPWRSTISSDVSSCVLELADLVQEMVIQFGDRYPELPSLLKNDISLGSFDTAAWVPQWADSPDIMGTVSTVTWADVSVGRAQRVIGEVVPSNDLLGKVLSVRERGEPGKQIAELHFEQAVDDSTVDAVQAMVRGLAVAGKAAKEIPALPVPISAARPALAKGEDDSDIRQRVARYRELRQEIDSILLSAL